MAEVPLNGGRLTAGVVRVVDTVRRPRSPASEFTAELLRELAEAGFGGAPRYLGSDELGRDILSFLPGDVPAKWRAFDDGQVTAAGTLLRGLHDAGRGLAARLGGGSVVCHHDAGRGLAARLGGGSVVCHHDAGPNNTVFRDGLPVAFIDFDFAAAGEPLEDVGYLAWSWCIASKPSRGTPADQARQVRVLADAYGLAEDQRRLLPDAIDQRLVRNERFWRSRLANAHAGESLEWTRRERAFVGRFREVFDAALE
jgi:hypothetical protein